MSRSIESKKRHCGSGLFLFHARLPILLECQHQDVIKHGCTRRFSPLDLSSPVFKRLIVEKHVYWELKLVRVTSLWTRVSIKCKCERWRKGLVFVALQCMEIQDRYELFTFSLQTEKFWKSKGIFPLVPIIRQIFNFICTKLLNLHSLYVKINWSSWRWAPPFVFFFFMCRILYDVWSSGGVFFPAL